MRFEGERKAGCSEQDCRSIPLDLLHRLRSRVPQCAQPARIPSINGFYSQLFLINNSLSAQALYGTVVFVMIGQAVRTLRVQYNPQVMSLYTASVLFYLAGFILWNLGKYIINQLEALQHLVNQTTTNVIRSSPCDPTFPHCCSLYFSSMLGGTS